MVVIMPGVAVSGDHDLKAVAPQLSGKGDSNAVCRIAAMSVEEGVTFTD